MRSLHSRNITRNIWGFYIQPINIYWISQEPGALGICMNAEEIEPHDTDLIVTRTNLLTQFAAKLKSGFGLPTPNATLSSQPAPHGCVIENWVDRVKHREGELQGSFLWVGIIADRIWLRPCHLHWVHICYSTVILDFLKDCHKMRWWCSNTNKSKQPIDILFV